MAAPKSGEFQNGNLWFNRRGNIITVGVTNAGINSIGTIQSIEFVSVDEEISLSEVLVTIDGTSTALEVVSPASGIVLEINEAIASEYDRLIEDPLEEGWLVKLEIEDPSELSRSLDDSGES